MWTRGTEAWAHTVTWIYGAVTSENHLAVNQKIMSPADWRLNEYREMSVLGIPLRSVTLPQLPSHSFWSLLCPNNNPHLLNRLKGAGRGLRSAWPKLFLPRLLWHVTWLTETLLANRKGNESMISLHAVKGKTFPFPQNCRPAGSFSCFSSHRIIRLGM